MQKSLTYVCKQKEREKMKYVRKECEQHGMKEKDIPMASSTLLE